MAYLAQGSRGRGKVLIDEGFKYQKNKATNTSFLWKCWRKSCSAKLKSNVFELDAPQPGIVIIEKGVHNHEADDEVIQRAAFVNGVKQRISEDPTRPIKRVYDNHVANAHRVVARQGGGDRPPVVPDFGSVRTQLARSRAAYIPPVPHSVEDVIIDDVWKETWRGQRLVLHQDNEWGFIIFATRRNIEAMVRCRQLYVDATFRTSPAPYAQIFNVLGDFHGRVLPFVTAFMAHRTVGHYRQVIRRIKRAVLRYCERDWQPDAVVMDFEQALITAVETELPLARLEGCYFHFNQALWRHIQELGLVRGYRDDDELRTLLRQVMALGFLPTALVRNNFRLLRTSRHTRTLIRRYPSVMDFLTYVQNTYVDGNFRIPMWNVFDRNMSCRTNNNAESFHQAWNRRVGVRHPNLWMAIRHLKDLQAATESGIRAMQRGTGQPTRRARRWRTLEDRLVNLKGEYTRGDRSLEEYWRAVAHVVHHF